MEQNNSATQVKSQVKGNEEVLTLSEYLDSCRKHWKWFLVSVIFLCGVAMLYILRQQPVYEREMAVLRYYFVPFNSVLKLTLTC